MRARMFQLQNKAAHAAFVAHKVVRHPVTHHLMIVAVLTDWYFRIDIWHIWIGALVHI